MWEKPEMKKMNKEELKNVNDGADKPGWCPDSIGVNWDDDDGDGDNDHYITIGDKKIGEDPKE